MSNHTSMDHGSLPIMPGPGSRTLWTGLPSKPSRATIQAQGWALPRPISFFSRHSNLRSMGHTCPPARHTKGPSVHMLVVASRKLKARLGFSKALHFPRSRLSINLPQQLTPDRDWVCNVAAATDRRQESQPCTQGREHTCSTSCVKDRLEKPQSINTTEGRGQRKRLGPRDRLLLWPRCGSRGCGSPTLHGAGL